MRCATVAEIKALGQRLEVARMRLGATYDRDDGKRPVSHRYYQPGKRCLYYGADGYAMILDRMKLKKIRKIMLDY